MENILPLIPPVLTLVIALWTKNIILALITGILSSSIIVNGFGFIPPILNSYVKDGVMGNFDIFIVLFLFGPILMSIKKAGGFAALRLFTERKLKSEKHSKFMVWLFAAIIGLLGDQVMSTIGVGSVMRPITDEYKVPREKLGFLLASTGPPVASLVPYSIFILFYGGLIQSVNPDLNGFQEYINAIPFNFYAFVSIIGALLFAIGKIPDFGYMKKCEARAKETGEVLRPGSHPIETKELDELSETEGIKPSILTFVLPMIVIVGGVIITYLISGMVSITYPMLIAAVVALFYPVVRGYYKSKEIFGLIFNGIKSMVPVILILTLAFAFGQAVGAVGFTDLIVGAVKSINLAPTLLPALTFLACCIVSYATGSLMTSTIIFAPIAILLAGAMGANLSLIIAASIGGSMFGDQTSPLSDMVVQPSMGAGVDVVDLAKAHFLYKALFAVLVFILFLVFGLVL